MYEIFFQTKMVVRGICFLSGWYFVFFVIAAGRSHCYNRSQLRFFLSYNFKDGEWTSVNVVHLKCGLWAGE